MEIIKGVFGGNNSILVKKTDFDEMFNISDNFYLTYSSSDDLEIVFHCMKVPKFEEENGIFYSEEKTNFIYKIISYKDFKEKLNMDMKEPLLCFIHFFIFEDGKFKLCELNRIKLQHEKLKKDIYYCIDTRPKTERKFNKI